MRHHLYALLLAPVMAIAGTSESILLDMERCGIYYLSNDPSVPYIPDPVKYKMARESHDKAIGELKRSHDNTWNEWEIQTGEGKRHYILCKEIYDPKLIRFTAMECHGGSDFPLQNLFCTYGSGNKWHNKCAAKNRPTADIRLYWEDMREYEEGENPNENMGYISDRAIFEKQCRQDR